MSHSFGKRTTADEVCEALQQHIRGRRVLVTGQVLLASRGLHRRMATRVSPNSIGEALVKALASHGADLILAGRSPAKCVRIGGCLHTDF
jgi:short-subunit dehydrogenase